MNLLFTDFEVFKNLWTVVIIDPMNEKETVIVNDREKFQNFYSQHKNDIWVTYNGRNYDQWIARAILCGFDPKEVNDWIIVQQRKGWEYSNAFRTIQFYNFDIMTSFHGLKQLEGFMGSDIRETTIPFDYEGEFTPEMIEEVIKYNRHDVQETIKVFLHRKNEFDAHCSLLKTFKLPIRHISKTQAQLAAVILGAERVELDDEWDIRVPDTLRLTKYKHVADWFLNPENHDSEKWLETDIAGVPHVFAWGGVHGAINQFNYICKDDEVMLMVDVDQLYPSLMVYYNLLSRAVSKPEKFRVILDTSLRLKAEGKKAEREPYKRICNITYGTMGDQYNPMYDPRNRALVCIYGELLLLDLVEKSEHLVKVIQSNTDGILVLLKRKDIDAFKSIVHEWEERTHLHMSFDEFEKIIQKDVNNYLAVTYNGKVKSKGAYVKSLNKLDYDLPIVNKAITDYFVNGTHPRETIMNCDDLIEFQKIVKVSSKYMYAVKVRDGRTKETWTFEYPKYRECRYSSYMHCDYLDKVLFSDTPCKTCNNFTPKNVIRYVKIEPDDEVLEKLTDRTFRVFASLRPNDGMLKKVKTEGAKPEKFANTPEKCFIWNDSTKDVRVPDHLDKDWYVNLAVKRIYDFGIEVKT